MSGWANAAERSRLLFAATTAVAILHVFRTSGRTSDHGKANPNMNVAEGV